MNESKNPNSDVWQMMLKLLCFKDTKSPITCFLFLVLFLLFCKLLCLMLFFNGAALVS
jgi:hypothetical protein